jgi:Lon-like ATP-dependent protease
MDIIRLSGYDIPEKVAIARQYLLPKALQHAGLASLAPKLNVTLTDGALDTLVRQYCRESGVRNLERHIEKLSRKVAFNLVKGDEDRKSSEPKPVGTSSLEAEDNVSVTNPTKVSETRSTTSDGASTPSKEEVAPTPKYEGSPQDIMIDSEHLAEYIGQPRFSEVPMYDSNQLPAGVVMGLGWSPLGGMKLC